MTLQEMEQRERYLLDRSRTAIAAATSESDGDLRAALLHQSRLLQADAAFIQMTRRQIEMIQQGIGSL